MFYALITIAGILSFLSVRSPFYPLRWAAGFSWLATFLYWLNADLLVDGSPADVAVMLVLFMLFMLFLLWGMAGRKGKVEVQDEVTSTGSVVRRIIKYDKAKGTPSNSGRETAAEYQIRIRSKLGNRANKGKR